MTFRIALPVVFLCSLSIAASAEDFAPMALNSVGRVPAKIAGAPVKDIHGAIVGTVARMRPGWRHGWR